MLKNQSILILQLKAEDREIAFGLLYPLGFTTWEERKKRRELELRVQIPDNLSPSNLLKKIQAREKHLETKLFTHKKIHKIDDTSWIRRYHQYLQPFKLPTPSPKIPPLHVDPRGRVPKKLKKDTLYIQAQLAFGTGTHASTQLAARLLQNWIQDNPGLSVLDVGCGTGILGMIAKKRGAGLIWAVDNDPEALLMASQNFKINKTSGINLKNSLSKVSKKFSLVIANILATKLIKLKGPLLRCLRKDGTLILSGMTYSDVNLLKKSFHELQIMQRVNQKGWAALKLKWKTTKKAFP